MYPLEVHEARHYILFVVCAYILIVACNSFSTIFITNFQKKTDISFEFALHVSNVIATCLSMNVLSTLPHF